MIDTVLLLATETKEAAREGFGLNLNILATNLFNLAILLGVVIYYGRKVLGQILGDRRSKIAEQIEEAETRQQKAAVALGEGQKKLTESQAEAERIIAKAQQRSQTFAQEIAAKAEVDIQRMRETAAKDLGAEQERVLVELRQRIAALALANVESRLGAGLDNTVQQQLIDRSLAQLGGK